MRQPQFIMYDDGSIGAYDPERDSIDETKVKPDVKLTIVDDIEDAPNRVQMRIDFYGDGAAMMMCPVTQGEEGKWSDQNHEAEFWDRVELDFILSDIRPGMILVDNRDEDDEDELDEDGCMQYTAGFKWIGDQWYGVGEACASYTHFRDNYPSFDFYLTFALDTDSELIKTVRYVG